MFYISSSTAGRSENRIHMLSFESRKNLPHYPTSPGFITKQFHLQKYVCETMWGDETAHESTKHLH